MKASLKKIIREKFGIHRGWVLVGNPENSLGAIKKALGFRPPFIEFDVILRGGEVWTGHPPQKPQSPLSQILPLFKGRRTYPKIDVRPRKVEEARIVVGQALDLLEKTGVDFALFSFAGRAGPRRVMQMENFLAEKVRGNPKVRLQIDLRKYGSYEDAVSKEVAGHLKGLGNLIHSTGLEIHEEDARRVALAAQKFGIGQMHFWARSWPDIHPPKVTEGEVREALALEEKYGLEVFFDINPSFVEGFRKIRGKALN